MKAGKRLHTCGAMLGLSPPPGPLTGLLLWQHSTQDRSSASLSLPPLAAGQSDKEAGWGFDEWSAARGGGTEPAKPLPGEQLCQRRRFLAACRTQKVAQPAMEGGGGG